MPVLARRRKAAFTDAVGTVQVAVHRVQRLIGRNDDLSLAAEDLIESCARVRESTRETADAAASAGAATTQVEAGATSVASAVEQMAAAMQEVAASASAAAAVTAEAAEVTSHVRGSVERLISSSEQIEGVVGTVTGISDRTRMLALNATIEAARAGEAGKGFAVVAEEVKNLAAQTGTATAGIADQIAELASSSADVRVAVDRIDEVLARVNALQQTIAAAVEEQTAAISEIRRSAADSAAAAQDLDRSVATSVSAAHVASEAMGRATEWLDRVATTIAAQRAEIAGLGVGVQAHPLRAAIVAHAAWKQRLRTAIDTGRLPAGLTVAAAGRSDACDFGRWLQGGEGAALDPVRCTQVAARHAEFHTAAAGVLAAVSARDTAHARALLTAPEGYAGAAAALTDAVVGWVGVVEAEQERAG